MPGWTCRCAAKVQSYESGKWINWCSNQAYITVVLPTGVFGNHFDCSGLVYYAEKILEFLLLACLWMKWDIRKPSECSESSNKGLVLFSSSYSRTRHYWIMSACHGKSSFVNKHRNQPLPVKTTGSLHHVGQVMTKTLKKLTLGRSVADKWQQGSIASVSLLICLLFCPYMQAIGQIRSGSAACKLISLKADERKCWP